MIEIIETGDILSEYAWNEKHPTVALPQPLTDGALSDYGARIYVEPPDIDALRASAISTIGAWRDAQEVAGLVFTHNERQWDGGLVVRQRLQPVISLAALPDGFFWTSLANEDVPMDIAGMHALNAAHEAALVARGFQIHARQRAMKADVAAMSAEQLAAFSPSWV